MTDRPSQRQPSGAWAGLGRFYRMISAKSGHERALPRT
jgi:hypothetical protein